MFDDKIYNFISLFKNDYITLFFKIITYLASSIFLLLICLLCIVFIKKRKVSILIIVNLLNTVLINLVLKSIFSRPRPLELMMIEESGFSFPSGHSMAALSFYGFLIYLMWMKNYKNKKIITVFLIILVILIGISRIYLGVHFASDVISGFIVSLIYLLLFTKYVSNKVIRSEFDEKI